MDANGLRFWLLGEARHFPAVHHAGWDATCQRLRLNSERTLVAAQAPAAALATAQAALASVARAIDALECVARWDAASGSVLVHSSLPDDAVVLPLPAAPTDLCAGPDGILYIAGADGIRMHDLRGRWDDIVVALAGFVPWRLAAAAGGGVWALERVSGRLARLTGRPARAQTPQPGDYDGRVFRPSPENGCAPRIELLPPTTWAAGEQALAIASGVDGALACLSWRDADGTACVRVWNAAQQRWSVAAVCEGANFAYALTWLASTRVALRVPGLRDAPAFDLGAVEAGAIPPLGDIYPLSDAAVEAPFANGTAQPPHYPSGSVGAEPLHPLSLNNLARAGEARNYTTTAEGTSAWTLDSHDNTTVWHRLYAEAVIPAHSGFTVLLAATNTLEPPDANDLTAWHAHGFGDDAPSLDEALQAPQVPQAAWEYTPSELPAHPGLLDGDAEPGVSGLFSVLIQNSRERVRSLVGRYLWVRVRLYGDGRVTPEIAALRAWGNRFSYADRYLPRLYRESLFGDAAHAPGVAIAQIDATFAPALDAGGTPAPALRARLAVAGVATSVAALVTVESPGLAWLLRDGASAWRLALVAGFVVVHQPQATQADFTARLLANFEGMLTPLEDRVAAAHLLSDPAVTADDNLDWLAGWIGIAFDRALPASARRDWLRAAPDLARWHGTRNGLRLALDIATGGAVRSGSVIVIEDFRLRRILATLLGVDLSDQDDPLLPGLHISGNSVVGDTLVIGDQQRVELMALFNASAATSRENDAVLRFDDQLAFRATVLVHEQVEPQDFTLIRRIAQLEAPAHVQVRVASASWPLLVGIASLVGVDTFLGPPRLPQPVQVQRSVLGLSDYVIGAAVLDPRLAGLNAALAPHDLAPAQRPRAARGSLVLGARTQPAIAKRGRAAPRRSRSKT
jgi:phage tail-like protein